MHKSVKNGHGKTALFEKEVRKVLFIQSIIHAVYRVCSKCFRNAEAFEREVQLLHENHSRQALHQYQEES